MPTATAVRSPPCALHRALSTVHSPPWSLTRISDAGFTTVGRVSVDVSVDGALQEEAGQPACLRNSADRPVLPGGRAARAYTMGPKFGRLCVIEFLSVCNSPSV